MMTPKYFDNWIIFRKNELEDDEIFILFKFFENENHPRFAVQTKNKILGLFFDKQLALEYAEFKMNQETLTI